MKVFGPVPSRRLGKSIGVNNIPYKICTYSCIYCQIGKAVKLQNTRQEFFKPDELADEVFNRIESITNKNEYTNYITIVPDGEPTLDINLGKLIKKLKTTQIPVAVITNSSLMQFPDVQNDLALADYVSVKIDTVNEKIWRKINKAHKAINFIEILNGISKFRQNYKGKFVSETMIINDINHTEQEFSEIADFISKINTDIAYIAIPTRPPAFESVKAVNENIINSAYQIFSDKIENVEYLTGYEGNAFSSTGNLENDILSITAVHPMREDAVNELVSRSRSTWKIIEKLIAEKKLEKSVYNNFNYYIRKFSK